MGCCVVESILSHESWIQLRGVVPGQNGEGGVEWVLNGICVGLSADRMVLSNFDVAQCGGTLRTG